MPTLRENVHDGRDAEAFARELQPHELEEKAGQSSENSGPENREADFGMHAVHEDDGQDILILELTLPYSSRAGAPGR